MWIGVKGEERTPNKARERLLLGKGSLEAGRFLPKPAAPEPESGITHVGDLSTQWPGSSGPRTLKLFVLF